MLAQDSAGATDVVPPQAPLNVSGTFRGALMCPCMFVLGFRAMFQRVSRCSLYVIYGPCEAD